MSFCRMITLFFPIFMSTAMAQTNFDELVKKADRYLFLDFGTSQVIQVEDFKGDKKLRTTKYKVYEKGFDMTLVETIFPERQIGRKLLMKKDDLWFYTPDIKRPTRVTLQEKLTGEVSNGDITRTHFSEDYQAISGKEGNFEGQAAYLISLKQRRSNTTYSLIDYVIAKKDQRPLQAMFKTSAGKNLKIARYSQFRKEFSQEIVGQVEIKNALFPEQRSVIINSQTKKEDLHESFFNKDSLSN